MVLVKADALKPEFKEQEKRLRAKGR